MDSWIGRIVHRSPRGNYANLRSGRRARPAIEMMEVRYLLSTNTLSPTSADRIGHHFVEDNLTYAAGDYTWENIPGNSSPTSALLVYKNLQHEYIKSFDEFRSTLSFDLTGYTAGDIQKATLEFGAGNPGGPAPFEVDGFPGGTSFENSDFDTSATSLGQINALQGGSLDVTSEVKSILNSTDVPAPDFDLRLQAVEDNAFSDPGSVTLNIQTIDPQATSTSLTANLPQQGGSYNFTPNTPYTLTATVQPQGQGAGTPNGVVDFSVDGVVTKVPLVNGVANLPVTPTFATVTASAHYEGSDDDGASDAPEIDLDAAQQASPTTTSLTADLPQQDGSYTFTPGTPFTLTATVQPQAQGGGTPTGVVDFSVDGAVTKVPLVNGVANLPVTPTGTQDKVDADYEGLDDDEASDAPEIDLDALPADPTITPILKQQDDGGTAVGYSISGHLPQGSQSRIELYWSPTKVFDPKTAQDTGNYLDVTEVDTAKTPAVFSQKELYFPADQGEKPRTPDSTSGKADLYLLAVVEDPTNLSVKLKSPPVVAYVPAWNLSAALKKLNEDTTVDKLNRDGTRANNKTKKPKKSRGDCARYVAAAIKGGGLSFDSTTNSNMGSQLLNFGFQEVFVHKRGDKATNPTKDFAPKAGDVAVFQYSPNGHSEMFNGEFWVSDFLQNGSSGFWPNQEGVKAQPDVVIYRYPSLTNS